MDEADDLLEAPEALEAPAALGVVVEAGRGSLPFALVHGESLVACAAWALDEAGVSAVDLGTPWPDVVAEGLPLVLHDPLCPLTPADFVRRCVAEAVAADRVVVAVRPVTDTVKQVHPDVVPGTVAVGNTVDRDGLRALASPVVLPARVVSALERPPGPDLAALVAHLAAREPVVALPAPAEARRVGDRDDVRVLEALTAPRR